MNLEQFLKQMVDLGASDIFIIAGLPLTYERSGQKVRLDMSPLLEHDTKKMVALLYEMAGRDFDAFLRLENYDDDFSFTLVGSGRFRVNAFRQRGSVSSVIRLIPFELPDPADINIPPEILGCATFHKGLVLLTGPAGAGKSTTLACIVDALSQQRSGHIITMEDPIEFIYRHNKCIITQRELITDVETYAEALRSAMRQKPNVILLGEMRDKETIETAILAAETGKLIFSTLHTVGITGAIDRIVDAFPATLQYQVRLQLSTVIQAIVGQQLIPATDGSVVPVFEIMMVDVAMRSLIREEKTHQIDSMITSGSVQGIRTIDQSLFELWKQGKITTETALQYSVHRNALVKRLSMEDKQ